MIVGYGNMVVYHMKGVRGSNQNRVLNDTKVIYDNITYIVYDMKSIIILGQAWPQTRTPTHTHHSRWSYINYRNIYEDKLDYPNNY